MDYCIIPIAIATLIALISNVKMVISIWKMHGCRQGSYLLFAKIGQSNAVFLVAILITGFLLNSDPSVSLRLVFGSLTLGFSLAQIFANIALACDRYYATHFPFQYRQNMTSKIWMKPLLIGETASMIAGWGFGYLDVIIHAELILRKVLVTARLGAILVMAVLYYKVFKKFRSSRVNVSTNNNIASPRNPTEGDQGMGSRHEKHLLKMCIGITATFAVLNLPFSIHGAMFEEEKDCITFQGKLNASFLFLVQANMAFDPFWYFYMEKRRRQRVPSN